MTILRGKRYLAFISVIVGTIGVAIYPIVISPMLNIEELKKIQEINRAGIKQEDIQPGNMKVWSDPFDRKKDNQ